MLLDLPEIPLPDWVAGIRLFGPVTGGRCSPGFYDGLRLATLVICVGAANSLANPKRLLALGAAGALRDRHRAGGRGDGVPAARRQRPAGPRGPGAARRGTGRIGRLRRLLVPVLEDALDRSLALAAGMDTRGYGRAGGADPRPAAAHRGADARSGCAASASASTPCSTAPRRGSWPLPMLVAGVVGRGRGLVSAGRRVQRTRYRPDPWRAPELVVAASGVVDRRRRLVRRGNQLAGRLPAARRRAPGQPARAGGSRSACSAACCPPAAAVPSPRAHALGRWPA